MGLIKLSLRIGSTLPADSIAYQVLQTRKKVDTMMESSLFGIPIMLLVTLSTINGEDGALIVVLPPLFEIEEPAKYKFLTGKQDEDWTPVSIEQILILKVCRREHGFIKIASNLRQILH